MDQLPQTPSWPAAPRGGITLVQHPAWEAARNAVLDLAAEGPVTVFLTGEPGSGKTWLLRELAASLGEHGFPTMALLRGDLPVPLGDGVAVLVDEASYMPEETRASLAVQDRGVVVLADIGPFILDPVEAGPAPVFIHLRLLDPAEVDLFVTDWLQQEKLPSIVLEPDAVSRLAHHSGGAVRLITQLLTAAVAVSRASGELNLTADLVDQVAGFRLGGSMPDVAPAAAPRVPAPPLPVMGLTPKPVPQPPLAPPPPPTIEPEPVLTAVPVLPLRVPVRRVKLRFAMTGTALAASVLAAWLVPSLLHRAPSVVPLLDRSVVAASQSAPELPPIQSAQSAAPDVVPTVPPVMTASRAIQEPDAPTQSMLAEKVTPPPSGITLPSTAPDALLPLQMANVPAPVVAPLVLPSALAAAAPAAALALTPAQTAASRIVSPPTAAPLPIAVASVPKPVAIPVIASGTLAPAAAVAHPVAAGLVLVARPGDTLERLYSDIYHDRRAPPFAAILAANPSQFKPGAIIVFPEPIGGWGRAQR